MQYQVQADEVPENSQPQSPEKYRNRILTCLAISPAGRALNSSHSIRELLEALRDAIIGHKSLFLERNILHRDVSENNIIITNPKENGGRSGMPIDFDLAVLVNEERQNERSDAQMITGTNSLWRSMYLEVLIIHFDTTSSPSSTFLYGYALATVGGTVSNQRNTLWLDGFLDLSKPSPL